MDKMPDLHLPLTAGSANTPKPSILIVDDVPANLDLLASILREHGYEARPVTSGRLALAAAKADPPSLILLDINMPEMNGFEVCERLKADKTLEDIPVLFLSALTETSDKLKAFSMGAVDYITKPFQSEEVCMRVGTHLNLRRLQAEVERYSKHLEDLVQEKISEISSNVTKRKRAEDELHRLATVVDQAGEAVCITDLSGIIQYVNPAFERITGYVREETLGKTPRILWSGAQDEDFYRNLWETISSGNRWEGRIINKRKDGTLYTETGTISPMYDASGRIVNYVSVKRDISEHLQMEALLNQAQKMEVVGRLSGGIAHDFDNLLSVITCYAQMLLTDPDLNDSARPQIQEIMRAGESASALTRQLLVFSRRHVIAPKCVDLGNIVSDMNKMLKRLLGKRISIRLENNPGLWRIKADPVQMQQIIMNLAVNARDSMPEGGKIIVKTENLKLEGDNHMLNSSSGVPPGSYVMLSVCDTGCGMSEEVRKHIFEPFFTTKDLGKGTGLGLATVYGIVKQSKGHIDVQSALGKGTTFRIYLPRHEGKTEQVPKETREEPIVRGHETILLVEDESALLNMITTVLENFGYRVLPANSSAEAIRLAGKHAGEIQLLLSNVIMPEMNGRELSEKLHSAYPALKCLFISGYAGDSISQIGMLDAEAHFIQKPFSSSGLAAKVRKVLDAK
jgi:PAS domain S-box-containing protein